MSQVTFVIQGRLNRTSLDNIENYKKYGDVIISTWDNLSPLLWRTWFRGVRVIQSREPRYRVHNKQNVFCQCYTTLRGVQESKTKFVIKVRSDERYTDWDYFIDKMVSNPHKIITNNVFFRYDREARYHPSDHVIGGSVQNIINGLSLTYHHLIRLHRSELIYSTDLGLTNRFGARLLEENYTVPNSEVSHLVAEQVFAITMLQSMGEMPQRDNSVELMKKRYDVVPCSMMGDILVRCNSCHDDIITDPELFSGKTYRSISNMDEL